LSLDPTTFTLYGGTHRGTIAVDLTQSPARWALDSRIETLDVHRFLEAVTGADQRLNGRGTVSAAVRGRASEPIDRTLQGQARVTVVEGVVRDFPLLSMLNQALRLADTDDRDMRFERLSATVAIGGGQARTGDLLLEAADVRVPVAGRIGLDGSLDLSGRVIFSERRSEEMIRSVRELTGLRNRRGEVEVPVTISGTTDDPSFAFDLEAILGKAIEDELRRRLDRLIRPPG
jgi:AsmA protein